MEHIQPDEKEKALINNPKYIGAAELIILRNFYYRDSYRKLLGLTLLLILIIVALVYVLMYERKAIPEPKYFATTYDGIPLARVPLRLPNLEPNALLTWATEAIISSYTLNFLNYRVVLQNSRSYFTRNGYENFLNALKVSGNMDAVKRKKMVVYARIVGTPTIIRDSTSDPSFRINGAYTWQIEFPMALIYENSNPEDRIIQNSKVTLLVRRLSTIEAEHGVGIDSMVLLPL
jgi:intracellular multiplication protein IcmL